MLEEAGLSKIESEPVLEHEIHEEIVAEYVISNNASDRIKTANANAFDRPETGWMEPAVRTLISMVDKIGPIVGKVPQFRTKMKMWKEIQNRLHNDGYSFTIKQISNKFSSLKRGYAPVKRHSIKKQTRRSHPYESEFNEIIENHEIKADNERCSFQSATVNSEADDSDNSDVKHSIVETYLTDQDRNSATTDKTINGVPNFRAEVMAELRSIREESVQFHSRVLNILETTENKKIKLMEERNVLLKRLLDKF
ncbi:uncharacterized protein LOC131432970 isoform X2 [Malaya genurostris]|nr:uncharacterized protein LOC131432970 isoform X2 [Malaya genurostris]